jgi:hypothetical protein
MEARADKGGDMKTTMSITVAVTIALLAVSSLISRPAHANLIVNGDFSTGIPNAPGWTITGNVFHRGPGGADFWFGAGTTAENGPGIIAFNAGNTIPNGSISQTFGTVAGASYGFEFDFGGTENTTQRLHAEILGSAVTPLFSLVVQDTNAPGTADNSLQQFSFAFVADGSQATVRFTDCVGDLRCGPINPTFNVDGVLDNVSITGPAPVPEPGTLALVGIAVAGLGLSRRRGIANMQSANAQHALGAC